MNEEDRRVCHCALTVINMGLTLTDFIPEKPMALSFAKHITKTLKSHLAVSNSQLIKNIERTSENAVTTQPYQFFIKRPALGRKRLR